MEVLENNFDEPEIILAGINNNGFRVAELLEEEMQKMSPNTLVRLTRIRVNPANPISKAVEVESPIESFKDLPLIIVDDVANTGRTLFYAFKPLLEIIPKKVEIAVLVNRRHKEFPVTPTYIGLSLATTLNENILVDISNTEELVAFLN